MRDSGVAIDISGLQGHPKVMCSLAVIAAHEYPRVTVDGGDTLGD